MGKLTTHVLDTASGLPARGLRIELHRLDAGGGTTPIASVETNNDGRAPAALLEGDALRVGRYRLCFHAAAYFRSAGTPLPEPPFLDVVTIDFGIADAAAHYHVPLLLSPYGYSTYRGS